MFVCVFLTEEQTHKTCNKTWKCKRKCRDNMSNALYSLGVTIVQGYYHHEISCVTTGNSIWSYLDKLGSKWTSDSKRHSSKSFEGSFESWSQPFPWQRSLNWLDYVLEEVSLPRRRHYFCHSSSASEKCSCRNVQWWDLFPAGKQPVKSDYGLPHLMSFLIAFSFTSTRKIHSDLVTAPKAAPKYSPIIFSECSVLSYHHRTLH